MRMGRSKPPASSRLEIHTLVEATSSMYAGKAKNSKLATQVNEVRTL
jgi:hypothetical protein